MKETDRTCMVKLVQDGAKEIRERAKEAFKQFDLGGHTSEAQFPNGFGLHRIRNVSRARLDYRVKTGWRLPVRRDKNGRVYVTPTLIVEDPSFVSRDYSK